VVALWLSSALPVRLALAIGVHGQVRVSAVTLPASHIGTRDIFLLMNVRVLLQGLLRQRMRLQSRRAAWQRLPENVGVEVLLIRAIQLGPTFCGLRLSFGMRLLVVRTMALHLYTYN